MVPSKTDYARNYNKKKFVFKVVTDHGAVYLLQVRVRIHTCITPTPHAHTHHTHTHTQASDAPSLEKWVRTIQDLNGGPPTPPPSEGGTLLRSSEGKLGPPSPSPHRRAHSPVKRRKGIIYTLLWFIRYISIIMPPPPL